MQTRSRALSLGAVRAPGGIGPVGSAGVGPRQGQSAVVAQAPAGPAPVVVGAESAAGTGILPSLAPRGGDVPPLSRAGSPVSVRELAARLESKTPGRSPGLAVTPSVAVTPSGSQTGRVDSPSGESMSVAEVTALFERMQAENARQRLEEQAAARQREARLEAQWGARLEALLGTRTSASVRQQPVHSPRRPALPEGTPRDWKVTGLPVEEMEQLKFAAQAPQLESSGAATSLKWVRDVEAFGKRTGALPFGLTALIGEENSAYLRFMVGSSLSSGKELFEAYRAQLVGREALSDALAGVPQRHFPQAGAADSEEKRAEWSYVKLVEGIGHALDNVEPAQLGAPSAASMVLRALVDRIPSGVGERLCRELKASPHANWSVEGNLTLDAMDKALKAVVKEDFKSGDRARREEHLPPRATPAAGGSGARGAVAGGGGVSSRKVYAGAGGEAGGVVAGVAGAGVSGVGGSARAPPAARTYAGAVSGPAQVGPGPPYVAPGFGAQGQAAQRVGQPAQAGQRTQGGGYRQQSGSRSYRGGRSQQGGGQ